MSAKWFRWGAAGRVSYVEGVATDDSAWFRVVGEPIGLWLNETLKYAFLVVHNESGECGKARMQLLEFDLRVDCDGTATLTLQFRKLPRYIADDGMEFMLYAESKPA